MRACGTQQGLEFARYSLDYHTIRNYIYVQRAFPPQQAAKHVPAYARRIVEQYDKARATDSRGWLVSSGPATVGVGALLRV